MAPKAYIVKVCIGPCLDIYSKGVFAGKKPVSLIHFTETKHFKAMLSLNLLIFFNLHVYARFIQAYERNVYKY